MIPYTEKQISDRARALTKYRFWRNKRIAYMLEGFPKFFKPLKQRGGNPVRFKKGVQHTPKSPWRREAFIRGRYRDRAKND